MTWQLQDELHEWRQDNFDHDTITPHLQLMGVMEEVGELAHAELKMAQGIRGDEIQHIALAKDAVGDIVIFLMGYCSCRDFDLEKLILEAADVVLERNWVKYPTDGLTK